jgi:hypothetical protein
MTIKDRSSEAGAVSRRQVLHGAVVAAGGAGLVMASVMPAQAKVPQKAAGYQDKPKDKQQCSSCAHFQPPSSCQLVDGTISPNGWCSLYSPKS